jgi:hypothetical protein
MRKASFIVFAILVMAIGAWAQIPTTNLGADHATSGSHVAGSGCKLCHTPHATGANAAAYTARLSSTATAAQITTWSNNFGADFAANGQTPATFNPCSVTSGTTTTSYAACVDMANNGLTTNNSAIYLWAVAMTPQTYTTWEGTTISGSGKTKQNAVVHTLLCLTCHDNATGSHEMGAYNNTWTNTTGLVNTSDVGNGEAIGNSVYNCNWDGAKCAAAWSNQSSLKASHPVHVAYSGSYMWKLNADGTFTDKPSDGLFAYGHPAKLWLETLGASTTAYVECTSCHDPHRRYYTSFWNGTSYTVSPTANTDYYIRGAYSIPEGTATTGGVNNANFCRSCHYSKSQAYIDQLGAVK